MKTIRRFALLAAAMTLAIGVTTSSPASALTQQERWVHRVYNEFLGRNATSNELLWQTTVLANGASRSSIVTDVVTSPDFGTIATYVLYDALLQRSPTTSEINAGKADVAAGDYDDIPLTIMGGSEYFTLAGSTNSGFVTAVYADVLDRSPIPSDRTFWEGQLNSGTRSRAWVATYFANSAEAAGLAVRGHTSATTCPSTTLVTYTDVYSGMYCIVLDRVADSTGAAFWINEVDNNGDNLQDLMVALASSSEYYNAS